MSESEAAQRRIEQIAEAFGKDGFVIADRFAIEEEPPRVGIRAEHPDLEDGAGNRKQAFYVEGTPRQMGYLMGRLSEKMIHTMSEIYISNYIREALNLSIPKSEGGRDWTVYEWLVHRVDDLTTLDESRNALRSRNEEIEGMYEGCLDAKSDTEVTRERLWALNLGIDFLFALLYNGRLAQSLLFGNRMKPRPPTGCNALAVLGKAAAEGAIFARDFMFPACRVFQDCACPVIYNPLPRDEGGALPILAMTTPGFVGCISAMNTNGVAAGVDVVHGGHNDPDRLGVNSLLLVRQAIEQARTIEDAARIACETPRGVSWLYPMAGPSENGGDRACVVEASATPRDKLGTPTDLINFLALPRDKLKGEDLLPTREELKKKRQKASPLQLGAMVRWAGFGDPCHDPDYMEFNKRLWGQLEGDKAWKLVKGEFGPDGMINETHQQHRCPSGSYFAPLRVESDDLLLVSNHYICPEMRLTGMARATTKLDRKYASDTQWRYDALNRELRKELDCPAGEPIDTSSLEPLSERQVTDTINYLEPKCVVGPCPFKSPHDCYYYEKHEADLKWNRKKGCPYRRRDHDPLIIHGAVSVFNLKKLTMNSYYGYYGDPWVKLQLMEYVV